MLNKFKDLYTLAPICSLTTVEPMSGLFGLGYYVTGLLFLQDCPTDLPLAVLSAPTPNFCGVTAEAHTKVWRHDNRCLNKDHNS